METETHSTHNQPSHAIFQVIGEDSKARWIRVGAAWPNSDGKGFTMRFDAYPVVGRTVMREIVQQPEGSEGGRDQ